MSAHWDSHAGAGPLGIVDTKRYVVMKRSPEGNRQWLGKDGKYFLLRSQAQRFSAAEAAELLSGNAVMEVAP